MKPLGGPRLKFLRKEKTNTEFL